MVVCDRWYRMSPFYFIDNFGYLLNGIIVAYPLFISVIMATEHAGNGNSSARDTNFS